MILEEGYDPVPPVSKPPKRHPLIKAARYPFRIAKQILKSTARNTFGPLTRRFQWWRRHRNAGHHAKLISADRYAMAEDPLQKMALEGSEIPIDLPQFIAYTPDIDTSPRYLLQPEVTITEYRNAEVIAATDFVIVDGYCIYPDQFIPDRDLPHAEKVDTVRIRPALNDMISSFDPAAKIDVAISLLSQSAGNYAHFITEVLPKLAIIDRFPEYADIPILVDIWMNPNHLEALKLMNTTKRKIWLVHLGQPVRCKRLIMVSPPSYAPPDYREFIKNGKMPAIPPQAYQFNIEALSMLRDKAHEIVSGNAKWVGKRLYVRRKISAYGNKRSIINVENIEYYMSRQDFEFIEPSSLTVREQIAAFKNAEVVVAPVGASLASLVYTKPGCKIVSLSAYFNGGDYDYFNALMQALGHDMVHVVGPQQKVYGGHPLHHPYRIPMDDVATAIEAAVR